MESVPTLSDRNPEGLRQPSIDVIMPAYNSGAYIQKSLAPLVAMKRRGQVRQVIVVDDGSTDQTRDVARSLGALVLQTGGRLGPAAARNLGAEKAAADILWFVDSDVVARADAADQIRRALSNKEVAAAFGSYDEHPEARNFFSLYKNLLHHYHHQNIRGIVSTFWAGCGAVWRTRFLGENGFDARRYPRPSIEDIEFGYRVRAGGGIIRAVPELQGTHLKKWTFGSVVRTDFRDRAIPWSRLLLRQEHVLDELNVTVTERIRAFIACLMVVAIGLGAIGVAPGWSLLTLTVLAIMAFAANLELFVLFRRAGGTWFAVGALLFHQLYYLYGSVAFTACYIIKQAEGWIRPQNTVIVRRTG